MTHATALDDTENRQTLQTWRPPDVTARIAALTAYKPGKPVEEVQREIGISNIVKMASNENPLGPSPKALDAIRRFAENLNVYPDVESHKLRAALSAKLDIDPACLVFGNGSDDIIHLLGITFLEPGDEVIQADPTFVRYEAAALLNRSPIHKVPLRNGAHDIPEMTSKLGPNTRMIFVCNPNNPTGTIVRQEQLDRLIRCADNRVLVVIDEAYHEYAVNSPEYPDSLRYIREGRNVVALRTFSKAYGLAGLRIGYGIMRPEIAKWLNQVREPFNINLLAQNAAEAALSDEEFVSRTIATNERGKRQLYAGFEELGMTFTPTYGNFIWVDIKEDGAKTFASLLQRGVIVRFNPEFRGPTHLRVSIGTEEQNSRFLLALREVTSTPAIAKD